MRILALETTALTGSLALLEDERVVAAEPLPAESRSAQSLVPAIKLLLEESDWPIDSVQLIAVAQGPGSFTGLRVGITAAKTLAYAIGAEVLGIDTLESLAAQVDSNGSNSNIHAILDAQRGQLFAAMFTRQPDVWLPRRIAATHIVDLEPWKMMLQRGDTVIGPPLSKLADRLPGHVEVASQPLWVPEAATIGRIAWHKHQAGERSDVWRLIPAYHRTSAAEEKAAKM